MQTVKCAQRKRGDTRVQTGSVVRMAGSPKGFQKNANDFEVRTPRQGGTIGHNTSISWATK